MTSTIAQLALVVTEKRCIKCDVVKPLAEFGKDKGARDGIHAICFRCRRSTTRPYWNRGHFKTFEDYFWYMVDRNGPLPSLRPDLGPCWLWKGTVAKNGYGTMTRDGHHALTHRVSYELSIGPIPHPLHIDHLCRVRLCCNPTHLEAVTSAVNNLRSRSPSAKNVTKTHCPYGHPYSGANLRLYDGKRWCRTCRSRRGPRGESRA